MNAMGLKLFATSVYVVKTSNWDKYKDYLIDTIEETTDPAYRPRDGFYTDFGQKQVWREVVWDQFLEPHIRPFMNHTHTEMGEIWAQRYIDKIGHTAHRHQPVGYSCVFYAEFDPEVHWGTTLFRPFLDPNDILNNDDCYTPETEEGNILIFPSWLLHNVIPSDTDVPRTIVAFNLFPKK